jgi:hypothetical protein
MIRARVLGASSDRVPTAVRYDYTCDICRALHVIDLYLAGERFLRMETPKRPADWFFRGSSEHLGEEHPDSDECYCPKHSVEEIFRHSYYVGSLLDDLERERREREGR